MVTPLLSSIDSFQLSPYKDSIAQRDSDLNKSNKNSYPKNPKGTSQQILGMDVLWSLFRSFLFLIPKNPLDVMGCQTRSFSGCHSKGGVRILGVNLTKNPRNTRLVCYIYHKKSTIHVGKYTRPMDGMGLS